MFRMQTSSVSPLTRLFKVSGTAVMVLSSEVSLLFSQFEPVPFSLPKTLPDNKSQGMQTTFSPLRVTAQAKPVRECPQMVAAYRKLCLTFLIIIIISTSSVFSLKSPLQCLSCSICLPLVLSIFGEEVVGGVEREGSKGRYRIGLKDDGWKGV